MASIETRSFWGDLVKGMSAKFAEVFDQANESYSLAVDDAIAVAGNKYTRLFKQKTSDKARERTVAKAGIGYLQNTPEGQAFAQDSRLPGYMTTWVFQKYTSGVTVTLEQLQDGDYQESLDEFADLTIAGKETMDRNAFSLFNVGFTAQASVGADFSQYGDAKPLFSTVHPRKDGGTAQSNASSTSIPLNEANLDTARIALMAQLDDKGKFMRVGNGKLILLVPQDLEKTAVIITKGEKRSGTANNDINIYDGQMTVIASQYLGTGNSFGGVAGTATHWYLIDPRVAKLVFWLRKGLTTSRYIDNRTKDTTFDLYARWVVGYGDWRGTWGSLGTSAAYSL